MDVKKSFDIENSPANQDVMADAPSKPYNKRTTVFVGMSLILKCFRDRPGWSGFSDSGWASTRPTGTA
jgi:hypothetical protein